MTYSDVHAAFMEFRAKDTDKVCACTRSCRLEIYSDMLVKVYVGPMHLLPLGPRKEHVAAAPALARMPKLPQRNEGAQPAELDP